MATNYDEIAEDYKASKQSPWRIYAEQWTFFELLGDVRGKRILDLACGEGFYSRRLLERGATRVVGVDLSAQMIELARSQEVARPSGVEYHVGDACSFRAGERFDCVVASYLLNYAQTPAQLQKMADTIAQHLEPAGRFVTINNNPTQSLETMGHTRPYGFVKSRPDRAAEGAAVQVIYYLDDGRTVRFENYDLLPGTHIQCLTSAGLRDVNWHPLRVSPEGQQKFASGYWDALLAAQPVILLDCMRA